MGQNIKTQKFRVYKIFDQQISQEFLSAQGLGSLNVSVSGPVPVRPIKFMKIGNEFIGVGHIDAAETGVVVSIVQRGVFGSQISDHPNTSNVKFLHELPSDD